MRKANVIARVLLAAAAGVVWNAPAHGQTVTPPSISIPPDSPVCSEGSDDAHVCIDLPPGSIVDKVDVFFLFDDTGSFAGFVPTVTGIFSSLVADLETALPGVSFGFGVGRFEDYGGPGNGFSSEVPAGRPFLLNQPIVTAATAGGGASRDALINGALARTAPGFGGDGPESDIAEGLYQIATGVGFDGDNDGATTGLGGLQPAGSLVAQTAPDDSGDVPAFSTLEAGVLASGNVGGAGFRAGALRLVILATDICSVAAFDPGLGIPATLSGTGGTEPTTVFACNSTTPGDSRFGFVSDSKTAGGNTVAGAVVPSGAGTVPQTIAALNAAGIRVLGMAPGGAPTSSPGPSFDPSVFLSGLARLTGAVDATNTPLVFDIGAGGTPLKDAIVGAIETTTTNPIDIVLMTGGTVPAGLDVTIAPPVVPDVPPGGQACFDVTFDGTGLPNGAFSLDFKDSASGAVLGTIPVDVACAETSTTTTTTTSTTTTTIPDHFQCYEIKPFQFPPIAGVPVVDQFGSHALAVNRPNRLCAPADKNDEDPTAPNDPDHLTGYTVRGSFSRIPNQLVRDQFGDLRLDLVRPDLLLVPAAKSLTPPPPAAPADPAVDHFLCYLVKRSKGSVKFGARTVKVDDQFGTASVKLVRPYRLCAPADKNGEDPGAETHPDHLLCYKSSSRATVLPLVQIGDQFGQRAVQLTRRHELCVPSRVNPQPTTTSTTVPPTTTSTTEAPTTTSTTEATTTTTTTLPGSPSPAFLDAVGDMPY